MKLVSWINQRIPQYFANVSAGHFAEAAVSTFILLLLLGVAKPLFGALPQTINLADPAEELPPIVQIYGDDAQDRFGSNYNAAFFGDLNGDGQTELAIGSYRGRIQDEDVIYLLGEGAFYVLWDGIERESAVIDFNDPAGTYGETRVYGDEQGDVLGNTVLVADVTNDGLDDLLVAAPYAWPYESFSPQVPVQAGEVYLFPSNPEQPLKPGEVQTLQATGDTSAIGETRFIAGTVWENIGWGIAVADFDADGRNDLALGAPIAQRPGFDNAGAVFVFWGQDDPFGVPGGPGRVVDMTTNNLGAQLTTILPPGNTARFGYSIDAGDFDGDGVADLAIGAHQLSTPSVEGAGGGAIVYGAASLKNEAIIDTRSTSVRHTIIYGNEFASSLGHKVHGADLDGDGYDDLLLGAPNSADGNPEFSEWVSTGRAYVLFGKAGGIGSGAGNRLVYDFMDGATQTGTRSTSLFPSQQRMALGWALFGGDVNGDGIDDLAVSAPTFETEDGGDGAGMVNVFYGGPELAGRSITVGPQSGDINILSEQGAPPGGSLPDGQLGNTVAMGDADSDGFEDLLMTSAYYDSPSVPDLSPSQGDEAGRAVLLFGDGDRSGSATRTRFAAPASAPGVVPETDFGPTIRMKINYPDDGPGAGPSGGASRETVTLYRRPAALNFIHGGSLPYHWRWNSNRSGMPADAQASALFRYDNASVAGLEESALKLYSAPAPGGPWTLVPLQLVQPDNNRMIAIFDGAFLSRGGHYFALAVPASAWVVY